MKKNNKGFLLVELVVSFAFVAVVIVVALQTTFVIRDKQDMEALNTRVAVFKMNLFQLMAEDLDDIRTLSVNANNTVTINGKVLSFTTGQNSDNFAVFNGVRVDLSRAADSDRLHISAVSCSIDRDQIFSCRVSFNNSDWTPFYVSALVPGAGTSNNFIVADPNTIELFPAGFVASEWNLRMPCTDTSSFHASAAGGIVIPVGCTVEGPGRPLSAGRYELVITGALTGGLAVGISSQPVNHVIRGSNSTPAESPFTIQFELTQDVPVLIVHMSEFSRLSAINNITLRPI